MACQRLPFPWGSKHIRDSNWYLYSNPLTTYSELMVAACKAESETEEAQDKVRTKSADDHGVS